MEVQDSLRNSNGGKILLRPSSSYNNLWGRVAFRIWQTPYQTSMTELFTVNSKRPKHVEYFRKKAPLQMFEWNSNAPPIRGTVNVGCR